MGIFNGILNDVASGATLGTSISPGVGSLLGGALGALGNVGSSLLGLKSQSNTNKAQMKLAEYEWQKNLEMWNLSNQYNSPEMQVARLKAAGLNPNLVFGGNSVGNTSGSIPTYQAPKLSAYTDFTGVGNAASNALQIALAYRDLDMKAEEKKLLSNQAEAVRLKGLLDAEQRLKVKADTAMSKYNYDFAQSTRESAVEAVAMQVSKMKQEIRESKQRVEESKQRIKESISRATLTDLERQIKEKTGFRLAEASIINLIASADYSWAQESVIDFENQLRDNGIDPKSPAAVKVVQSFANTGLKEWSKGIDWVAKRFGYERNVSPADDARSVVQGGAKVRRKYARKY